MASTAEWIAQLTERRRALEGKLKPLQAEIEAIDAALADLDRLAAFDTSQVPPVQVPVRRVLPRPSGTPLIRPPVQTIPVWKWAFTAMAEADRPMAIPELAREIYKRGGPQFEGEQRESLRTIVRAKENIFEPLGDGLYAIREWPAEKKKRHV